jgi:DNA-binding response OmpR family regulator
MSRVLIADDEPRIVSFIEKGLRAAGFTTLAVGDGEEAARLARGEDFDLLILDLGLPRLSGFEVLEQIRGRGERLPVIVLTARNELADTVEGLERGATDYLTKPFRFDELLARVRAHLRDFHHLATGDGSTARSRTAGAVTLDLHARRIAVDGREADLSTKEFQLADVLMQHAGQVLSREQLLSRVWGYDYDGGSNVVEVYVGYLRRKIGAQHIETVRGAGYRFKG